ncbi:tRNA-uridine aminocarboxypropyltransferase [Acidaminobacter sp. JC074]|uniref:tRNA-uridine aminocarboxypropyltransferase n=1 Tax=Acidaminobacter sp. JC074 TaxID=2530199 RepID=UPI001F0F2627|nr:DTW domain-containing protein [Acidaminobacter sp. JC074]
MKRTFQKKVSKNTIQCETCGLVKGRCICDYEIDINAPVEFWLLTHENEFSRTNNTGRLIEYAIASTRVFAWSRTETPSQMIALMDDYDVYLVFADDRDEEKKRVKSYEPSEKKTVFIILDGTWKEARKMLRKSPYLADLPIIALNPKSQTSYDLRRNKDQGHLCTVEVAVALLDEVGAIKEADALNMYFEYFMDRYHDGKYEHGGTNDQTII